MNDLFIPTDEFCLALQSNAKAIYFKEISFNVVLAATLFHPLYDSMNACNVGQKYTKVINEKLFKKVFIRINAICF